MFNIKHAVSLVLIAFTVAGCGSGGSGSFATPHTPIQGPTDRVAILDPTQSEVVVVALSADGARKVETIPVSNARNLTLDQSNQTLYLSSDRLGHSTTTVNLVTGQQRTFGEEYRSDSLVKGPGSYLYSAFTQTTMTDNILRPRTQGYVQRISTETGAVEFSDLFGTPEFSALAVHPSNGIVYAIEPKVQASNSDPLCLQDSCNSEVVVYSLAITENANPYSGGIATQWFEEVTIDDFMNVQHASFNADGSTLYLSGASGTIWSVSLAETSTRVIQLQGVPEYRGRTYLDVEEGGRTGLIAAPDLGLYRVELESGRTSKLVGPGTLFTGVSGLQILD